MLASWAILGALFGTHITSTYATHLPCKNGLGVDERWACADQDLKFPTVACIREDIKKCGNVGENSVFYSFGAKPPQAQPFGDTLNPRGIMFLDTLGLEWMPTIKQKFPILNKENAISKDGDTKKRHKEAVTVLNTMISQAFAMESRGTAYVVVLSRQGGGGGEGKGAFQQPLDNPEDYNRWQVYEFPAVQHKSQVTKVVSVDLSNQLRKTVDWERRPGAEKNMLVFQDADNLVPPEGFPISPGGLEYPAGSPPPPGSPPSNIPPRGLRYPARSPTPSSPPPNVPTLGFQPPPGVQLPPNFQLPPGLPLPSGWTWTYS